MSRPARVTLGVFSRFGVCALYAAISRVTLILTPHPHRVTTLNNSSGEHLFWASDPPNRRSSIAPMLSCGSLLSGLLGALVAGLEAAAPSSNRSALPSIAAALVPSLVLSLRLHNHISSYVSTVSAPARTPHQHQPAPPPPPPPPGLLMILPTAACRGWFRCAVELERLSGLRVSATVRPLGLATGSVASSARKSLLSLRARRT